MPVHTTPHLNFRGDAREALEFYSSVFGGQLMVITNEDAQSVETPDEAHQVKFGQVLGDNGFRIMAYDVPASVPYDRGNASFFVSIRGESTEEISGLWTRLTEGSTILDDLAPSFFSPAYGMLSDRFGVTWVLDVEVAYNPA
ncbi:VOC family protein [Mycetocola manganoxydans]|uniref:VOC family protein n=1 Tax=Mycetocola manganoxydans TaxID=699879 RepID=A0A3L7A1I4_9MICO|nr:VOC family protein [Mycetocola manganoxydans]RLP73944.1 VOC family protein [Mycetocola manganoxydans]GHD42207.1 VOC family protein [Mycetocola manganoxydans]